ncbi:MAG: CoA synthetase [Betaproteobacteria bacterium]|nr:CoA synthetase [Betaproteobacteria bacterium]
MWVTLESMARSVPDGAMLAVPKDSSGVAMAATRELIRRGVRDLHLVCVPTSGIQADLLAGAGAVRCIETSAVTLGEYGTGPRFAAAARQGTVHVLDSTCPAIYAALQAGQKGLPFIPLRGLIGSDVMARRADWKTISNPFGEDDPIALLPALRPDFALFHASMADRDGNVFIGREREVLLMAQAAKQTLVTVERMAEGNLLEDEARAGAVIPSIYITQLALAPRGASPLGYLDLYEQDEIMLGRYARMARTEEGFNAFVQEWLRHEALTA